MTFENYQYTRPDTDQIKKTIRNINRKVKFGK